MDKQKDFEKGWEEYKKKTAKEIEEMASCLIGEAVTGSDSTKVLRLGYITVREIASILYNAGYRKIPKCAVVLTEEEHKRYMEIVRNDRKETAEKFAERLKAVFGNVTTCKYDKCWYREQIDEICKEITEGK